MALITTDLTCPVHDSFRVRQIAGMFDVTLSESRHERFSVEIPDLTEDWKIGVIVGPSGSGKTSVGRQAFGEAVMRGVMEWPEGRAVVDCFGEITNGGPGACETRGAGSRGDPDYSVRDIVSALTGVGFSSPPSWVKPYAVLSNGERFRCDLARALLSDAEVVVFDEFTSVVDRTVAQVGSAAVAKAIRGGRLARRFVAVTCHYDVLPWLEPDWVVDMADCSLTRRCLRRPCIELQIQKCPRSRWGMFKRHHYLSGELPRAVECYLACWRDRPVTFVAVASQYGCPRMKRISRLVTLPDYQGIGIGLRVAEAVASLKRSQDFRVTITASHPAVIRHCAASPLWRTTRVAKAGRRSTWANSAGSREPIARSSVGRAVVSFEFK